MRKQIFYNGKGTSEWYLRVMEDYEIPLRKEYLIEGNYDYASGYDESGL